MALFRRRIRSALYIDYENVPLNPDTFAKVIAWLEDGMFDEKRVARRFDVRRIYWNSQSNRFRKAFEDHGFEVVLIEKYGGLKNGADIRIAMDMVETALKQRTIEEFVLISRDSDFVPVIQRLGEKDKRTIMLVEEQQPASYTAYDLHADGIITYRALQTEAQQYERPKRGIIEKLGLKSSRAKSKAAGKPQTNGTVPPQAKRSTEAAPATDGTPASRKPTIDQAVDAFVKVASRNPGKLTGKQTILKQLKTVKGFTNTGSKPYLGYKTYEALAKEVAKRDPRITLQSDRLGGMTVVYAPADEVTERKAPVAALAPDAIVDTTVKQGAS